MNSSTTQHSETVKTAFVDFKIQRATKLENITSKHIG